MCFVWIWEQTAIISLYSINWLVCITETECVYCAVRSLNLTLQGSVHSPVQHTQYHYPADQYVCLKQKRIRVITNNNSVFPNICTTVALAMAFLSFTFRLLYTSGSARDVTVGKKNISVFLVIEILSSGLQSVALPTGTFRPTLPLRILKFNKRNTQNYLTESTASSLQRQV